VTSLASWGPTLVIAFVALAAAAYLFAERKNRSINTDKANVDRVPARWVLAAALRDAESVNAYKADLPVDPHVHLMPVVRLSPTSYRDAVIDIPRYFDKGQVVAVDIASLNTQQAARLVDFCSGYLVGACGWLYRAADKVIVLTPIRRNTEDAP
jgi:FtsZ-interacting cell division protein YlmF